MRFEILGPLRGWGEGREVVLTAGRERTLLAMLLVHANHALPADQLIDAIWGPEAPRYARNQLQGCVHRLRRRLHDAGITGQVVHTEPHGYRAAVEPEQLDLLQFRRLVRQARAAADNGEIEPARAGYRAALDQWRGPALAGIDSQRVHSAAAALAEERLHALEERIHLDLAAGAAGDLVAELTDLTNQHPHRERVHAARMLALYRAGRQADALAAYRHARDLFLDELGTEPGTDLQQLHQAILNHDPTLHRQPPHHPRAASPSARPRELPADVAGFTGRSDALKALDGLLPDGQDPPGAVVISTIAGTAGVGKTALAVHWAHRVADEFPDGQLYLNLRGYAAGPPLRPIEALSAMLRSLGMPADQIPTDEAEASARYRSLLAGRRVLVILDNARSGDQVRPLLPGTSRCMALVTSRDRLGGLVARDGARRITLDVLPADEAYALLTHLLGAPRVTAEPAATAELARACAYLPLALRIAAATLDEHPHRSIQDLAADLTAGQRLAALEIAGDQESAVRAALDLSYRAIPEPAQRLFRLLGLVPGPDFVADTAAALADLPTGEAQSPLDRLASAHLITEHRPGRYTFHDILREYARDCAERQCTDVDRMTAVRRLFDWYLYNADAASRALRPNAPRLPIPPGPSFATPPPADRSEALAFLDSEQANITAAVHHAYEHGPRPYAWLLADRLRPYLWLRTSIDGLAVGGAALAAAEAEGGERERATAGLALADGHFVRGEHQHAAAHYRRAVVSAERAGSLDVQATIENNLAVTYLEAGRPQQASVHLSRALAVNQRAGRVSAQASNLGNLGYLSYDLGNIRKARDEWERALAIQSEIGAVNGEAISHANLGRAYHMLGQLDRALEHLGTSLKIHHRTGDEYGMVFTRRHLAQVHLDAGRYQEALEHAKATTALIRPSQKAEQAAAGITLATAYLRLGRYAEAVSCYEDALGVAEAPFVIVDAHIGLATVQLRLGRHAIARERVSRALEGAQSAGYRVLEAQALAVLAELELSEGHPERAQPPAEQALEIHRDTGHRLGEAHALAVLGRVRGAAGDPAGGRRYGRAARRLFEEIGAPPAADLE